MSITGYTQLDATDRYSYLIILTSLSQTLIDENFISYSKEKRHEMLDKLAETSEYLYNKYQKHFDGR